MTQAAAQAPALPLFYRVVVPLDSAKHHRVGVKQPRAYGYAAQTAVVPVLAEEMGRLCGTYPIVFHVQAEAVPVALVGVRAGRNLFVDAKGAWLPRAPIPSYVQRYPFILLETTEEGRLALGFDETSDAVGPNAEAPLFDREKKPTPMLEGVLRLCSQMKQQGEATEAFAKAVAASGILVDQRAELVIGGKERITLSGFKVVDERRFLELPDETWVDWKRKGWIGLVYAHLLSLERLSSLTALAEERGA
jgi:hypothetical protein